ncbi:MAG: matrixin family metalloprotease [Nitrosopumilaceae archaeon]
MVIEFESTKKKFLIILLIGLVTNVSYASAQTYREMDFKLAYDPTICAIEPDDHEIPDIGKALVDESRYSVLDWQTKLREITHSKDKWTISFIPVSLDQKKNFNYTQCDIEIYFERAPQEESEKFRILGVTSLEETTSKPTITIYYLQIDPNLQYRTIIENNIIYYWYEGEPRYLDIPRNDDQLASVIRHEIGHALGLGHYVVYDAELYEMWEGAVVAPPSVMIQFSPEFTGRIGITPIDVEKIISIYGYNSFGQKTSSEVGESNKMKPTISTIILEPYENEKYQFSMGVPKGWSTLDLERVVPVDPIVFFQDDDTGNSANASIYFFDKEETVASEKYLTVLTSKEEKRCEEASVGVEKYSCEEFKVMDSDVIQIKNEKAYQLKYSWVQDEEFSVGTIVTEIPKENEVWRIEANIFGLEYPDFIGEVEASTNSFTLISGMPVPSQETVSQIPSWIKNNAKWWSENAIGDDEFVQGIGYLIKEGILKVPPTEKASGNVQQHIPDWIKNNAKWWSDDAISDSDFIKGIQYLVENGIIKV